MKKCIQCGGLGASVSTGRYCPECYKKRQLIHRRARIVRMRSELLKDLGGKCIGCGNEDARVLECHHIDSRLKSKDIRKKSGLYQDTLTKLYIYKTELGNLQLLCANCHRIHNWETIWKSKYDTK